MISQFLDEKDYLHAPSQGALGVECHKSDEETKKLLSFINNTESEIRCTAERKFLNRLEGVKNKRFLILLIWLGM